VASERRCALSTLPIALEVPNDATTG